MIRVLVVDDHPWFREGRGCERDRADDVAVVAQAADGSEALALAAAHRPDVVVLDLAMPVMDGPTALPGLVEACARVLVLTLSEEDATVLASIRSGAAGYLVKGVPTERLLTAIRAVADGHAVFGPGLAARLLAPDDPELPELSVREREVMTYVARGLTNVEIAETLVISPITVRNHVSSILTKLQVANRTQAVLKFRGVGDQE